MTIVIGRLSNHRAALGLCGLLSFTGCLASEAELTPEDRELDNADVAVAQAELVGGTKTSARPEIGWLSLGCTGTLIGSSWVLAAAHCLEAPLPANITFTITSSLGVKSSYPVIASRAFEHFDDDDIQDNVLPDGLRDDVAVLRLGQAVPSSVATPAAIAAVLPTSGTQTIFGYGCTQRPDSHDFGTKQYFSYTMPNTSSALCPGDSGGPVTIGAVNSGGAVWGVNSGYLTIGGTDVFGSASWYKEDILAQIMQWISSPLVEAGVDRPGMDYRSFAATSAQCMTECQNDAKCRTFTFSSNNCWLKAAVPDWSFNSSVSSGSIMGIELNVDRPGGDYFIFDVPAGRFDTCLGACARDAACKVYTLAPPAVAGGQARCHLKSTVAPVTARSGLVSGVKRGLEVDVDRPGSDKQVLTLTSGTVTDCQWQCAFSADCRAFTWEQATKTCRLKSGAAKPVFKGGVTSGIKRGVELNRDRPGGDYRVFDQAWNQNTPRVCQAECMKDLQCQAWTFIPAHLLGDARARCSLKSSIPGQTTVQGLVSGVRGSEFF